jgi:hypothetical protein
MSQFEYVSIPVSLILTFAVARLLSGFPHLLSGKRTYWVHTLWCIQAITNCALFWCVFWNAHDEESWTLGSYLITLAYPGLLYVGATIFVPSDVGPETDWHRYYFDARKSIFTVAAVATSILLVTSLVVHGESVASPRILIGLAFIGLYAVAYISEREGVHKAIVVANAAVIVAAYAPSIYTPFSS